MILSAITTSNFFSFHVRSHVEGLEAQLENNVTLIITRKVVVGRTSEITSKKKKKKYVRSCIRVYQYMIVYEIKPLLCGVTRHM